MKFSLTPHASASSVNSPAASRSTVEVNPCTYWNSGLAAGGTNAAASNPSAASRSATSWK